MREIVIATRESPLALWQAEFVRSELERAQPGLAVSLLGMRTQGDKWLSSPLSEVGGKGLFIKELEQALLEGRAHIAVHSMKDVPAVIPEGFVLPAIGFRDDVRDALVSHSGATFAELPAGARVGSASLRRQAQLRARRPDLQVLPIRGNVGTRLGKMEAGEFDAVVLAAAGLARLQLSHRVTEYFSIADSVPAAGQGALGIECREDAAEVRRLLDALNDPAENRRVQAERAVSLGLGADCSSPLGAYAELVGDVVTLQALLASVDGSTVLRAQAEGRDPAAVGAAVVASLEAQGARAILAELE